MCKTTNRQFVLTTIFLATAACGSSSESETSAVQTNDVHSIGDLDSPPYDSAEVETQEVDDDDTQEPINPLNAAPVDSAGPHQVAYRVETVRYTQSSNGRAMSRCLVPTKDISGEPSTNFDYPSNGFCVQ